MSVCVCVCPAMRFHISQRIFSKFGGNFLRVITRWVGYIFVCARNARACACVLSAHVCVRLYLDVLSPNLLGIYYESPQVAWAMYFSCSNTARVRVRVRERACVSVRSSLDGFSPNLLRAY
jgi:hypothetical protein